MHNISATKDRQLYFNFERHAQRTRPGPHALPALKAPTSRSQRRGLTFEDRGKHCHDCTTRVSLLPSRRYPQAWSEITIVHGPKEVTIYFCPSCGPRRLESGDDAVEIAA